MTAFPSWFFHRPLMLIVPPGHIGNSPSIFFPNIVEPSCDRSVREILQEDKTILCTGVERQTTESSPPQYREYSCPLSHHITQVG